MNLQNPFKSIFCLCFCLLTFSFPTFSNDHQSPSGSTLKGKVFFPEKKAKLLKRMKHYEGGHAEMGANDPSQGIVILQPTSFTPSLKPTQNAVLTQKGMNFFPRVLPVTKGSTVYILNEDKEYHNVFSRTPGATFNIGRRPPGHLYPQKIKKSGLIRVFCDIHEQMNAIILSLETPYFVRVGKDNSYTLPNLPDGKYKMVVYHPEYPAHEEDVEISGSQIVTKDIHWK